jgi:nucleoside recognition membrane protein YjiH
MSSRLEIFTVAVEARMVPVIKLPQRAMIFLDERSMKSHYFKVLSVCFAFQNKEMLSCIANRPR